MARNYYKVKPYSVRVMNVIAGHYYQLKTTLCPVVYGNYSGRNTEDIFNDTIIYVIQDEAALQLIKDSDILDHFKHRFNMIRYQIIMDSKEVELPNDHLSSTIEDTSQNNK